MAEKPGIDDATHDSGIRNADHAQGSDAHVLPPEGQRHIDPAQEVMERNPNLSPPIHPHN
jgi:hypothetical protein